MCGDDGGTASSSTPSARSAAKNLRKTTYSAAMATSHGAAINAAKRVKDIPALENASRFVRFDTGSNSEAVFARCALAYVCGRLGSANVRAVASTTGVSSTTVASRLRTAVV